MCRQQARGPAARVVLLALAVGLAALGVGRPARAQAIPRDAAGKIAGLLGDSGGDRVLPGGYVFTDVKIDRDRVTYVLSRKAGGQAVGRVRLLPRALAKAGDQKSVHFAVRVEADDPDPQVKAALEAAAGNIVRRDRQDLWVASAPVHADGNEADGNEQVQAQEVRYSPAARRAIWLAQVALAVLLLVGLGIFAVRRPRHGAGAGPPSSP